jgi:hypothetical protein
LVQNDKLKAVWIEEKRLNPIRIINVCHQHAERSAGSTRINAPKLPLSFGEPNSLGTTSYEGLYHHSL